MSYTGNLKKGDRVRVTFEGTVSDVDAPGFGVGLSGDYKSDLTKWFGPKFIEDTGLTVEKIEPPVEVFGPGSLLRARRPWGTSYWYLAEEGYIRLAGGDYTNVTELMPYEDNNPFTSERYERVELS